MGHADTRVLARYQDVVSELQWDAAARMDAPTRELNAQLKRVLCGTG
jgi:hypothetical protein